MQLKKRKCVRDVLAVATCSLLSNAPQPAAAAEAVDPANWTFDFDFLNYQEADDRIRVQQYDAKVVWDLETDKVITGSYTFDSITGSSPSGATLPKSQGGGGGTDTSTTASGASAGTGTGAETNNFRDELGTFVDRRNSLNLNWNHALTDQVRYDVGGTFSLEDDYDSLGANGSVSLELNNKLTVLDAGFAYSWDTVSPENGPPQGGELADVNDLFPGKFEDGKKRVWDRTVGLTQILNRRTLVRLSYTAGQLDGYLNDPYKIVSVVDSDSGDPVTYYSENRPTTRSSNAIYMEAAHQPKDQDVINVSYRYYWDDWGITSHTLDFRYRYEIGTHYIQPHIRFYRQSAADFFYPYLTEDQEADFLKIEDPGDRFFSSDYRLDKLTTTTIGIKYGLPVSNFGEFRIRIERMMQRGTKGDFKDLDATIFQMMITLYFR
jgi:hypothetical protein